MNSTSKLINAMNTITLEDEDEGVLSVEELQDLGNNKSKKGFDAKLCVVGKFISEGYVDFQAM